jgi:hypothetical protein
MYPDPRPQAKQDSRSRRQATGEVVGHVDNTDTQKMRYSFLALCKVHTYSIAAVLTISITHSAAHAKTVKQYPRPALYSGDVPLFEQKWYSAVSTTYNQFTTQPFTLFCNIYLSHQQLKDVEQ